tara:strand:+ start:4179 stop:4829 length:651 start_codon:yes stop_codon:yes gene_type:complete
MGTMHHVDPLRVLVLHDTKLVDYDPSAPLPHPSPEHIPLNMRTTRLTLDDWLVAGFDALQRGGQNALAAEPLARQLGTTKGSFYWHFKDVPAFHAALIANWYDAAMATMLALVERDGPADQRLRSFGKQVLQDPIETRLRFWAQTNADVADALHKVDAERLAYLVTLLRQLGLGNPDFARALLATLVGLPLISPDDLALQSATFDTLVDTVLALSQ